MLNPTPSPYLEAGRLTDVIAAIQAMGTYKFYKLPIAGWADRIAADEDRAGHWLAVFRDHPEFFRLTDGQDRASLVWRRNQPRTYHVDLEECLSRDQITALPAQERKDRLTRAPLVAEQITALVTAAIDLHARALEHRRDSRWWVSIVAGLAGGLAVVAAEAVIGRIG